LAYLLVYVLTKTSMATCAAARSGAIRIFRRPTALKDTCERDETDDSKGTNQLSKRRHHTVGEARNCFHDGFSGTSSTRIILTDSSVTSGIPRRLTDFAPAFSESFSV